MTEPHVPEDNNSKSATDEADAPSEPLNRAERRAAKRNKGKNKPKGVTHGGQGQAFTPKDVKMAGHKEFTNRKSG